MTTSEATKKRAGVFTLVSAGFVLVVGVALLLIPTHGSGPVDVDTLVIAWFLRGAAAMAGAMQVTAWLLVLLMPDEPDPPKSKRPVPGPTVLAAREATQP